MPRRNAFTLVESIGRTLPDVEVTTTWGQPTLKVRGKMFLSPVHPDALRDLIAGAHRYVSAKSKKPARRRRQAPL